MCGLTEDSHEITLYALMRHCAKVLNCQIAYDETDDSIGEFLTDQLLDGLDSPEGILAHFFTTAWAFSELRAKLKQYEDTGLMPEEVVQVNDFQHSQCARLLAECGELRRRLAKINNLAVEYQEDGPFDDPQEGFNRMDKIYRLSLSEEGGPR